jgi:hypothetical protein
MESPLLGLILDWGRTGRSPARAFEPTAMLPRFSALGSGCGFGGLGQDLERSVHRLCIGEQAREIGFEREQYEEGING